MTDGGMITVTETVRLRLVSGFSSRRTVTSSFSVSVSDPIVHYFFRSMQLQALCRANDFPFRPYLRAISPHTHRPVTAPEGLLSRHSSVHTRSFLTSRRAADTHPGTPITAFQVTNLILRVSDSGLCFVPSGTADFRE